MRPQVTSGGAGVRNHRETRPGGVGETSDACSRSCAVDHHTDTRDIIAYVGRHSNSKCGLETGEFGAYLQLYPEGPTGTSARALQTSNTK